MVKKQRKKQKIQQKGDKTLAVIGLLVNIFLMPGAGTIICGRFKAGLMQVILFILGSTGIFAGMILSLLLIGLPILVMGVLFYLIAWVWALISSIQILREANQ